jgi:hypothetical protein
MQELVEAIKQNDLNKVKELLHYQKPFIKEQETELLKVVQESIHICQDKTQSLLKSSKDLRKILGGTLAIAVGIFTLALLTPAPKYQPAHPLLATSTLYEKGLLLAINKKASEATEGWQNFIIQLVGITCMAFGVDQGIKGWRLQAAFNDLRTAQTIKKLIELFARSG